MTTRADIVEYARTALVGTPYHHLARLPGVGIDCIGVVISTARHFGMVAPTFDVKGYARTPDGRSLIRLSDQHLVRRGIDESLLPGIVVVMAILHEPQHFGILADYRHGGLSIIHAYADAVPPRVVEQRFMPSQRLRLVAAFDFPGVTE